MRSLVGRRHLVRRAVLEEDLVRCDRIPHKAVANFNVLDALVLDGSLGEVDAAAVVEFDVDRPNQVVRRRHEHGDALAEFVEQNSFLAGLAKSHVLCLHGRERHRLLQLRSPADGRPA